MGKYQVSLVSLENFRCVWMISVAQLFSFSVNSKTPINNRIMSMRWQHIIQFSGTEKIIPTLETNIYSMFTQKSYATMYLFSLLFFGIVNFHCSPGLHSVPQPLHPCKHAHWHLPDLFLWFPGARKKASMIINRLNLPLKSKGKG